MAVTSGTSLALSSMLTVLIFSGMQMYKGWLTSSQPLTLFAGLLSSLLFITILTAVGSLESMLFGKGFQMKLMPEVILCLGIALTAAGMVHRICTTVCLVLSIVHLYYINAISVKTYGQSSVAASTFQTRKKK